GTPCGFAHIGGGSNQTLLDPAIARDGGQYTMASGLVCVEDQLAVGGEARAFIDGSRGEHLHLARGEILRRDREAATVAAHERKALAVRERPRGNVVAAIERHALDGAAADIEPVDLRAAAAVRREQDRLA